MAGDPSFWSELKERRVVRVALVYLAVGWFVIEASDTLTDVLDLPDVTPRLVLALVALGLPIALTLAWIYQRTPTGIERAEPSSAASQFSLPVLAAIGVSALAVALAGWQGWQMLGDRNPEPTLDPERLAVFPFAVRSPDAGHVYLGDGFAELLSTALHGTDIQVIDPGITISRQPPQEQQEATARELGAGHFISGSVASVGGRQVQVRASLFTLGEPTPVTAQTTGSPDSLLTMVGALTRQLLVGHAVLSLGQIDSLALTMTDSVEALKAYLRGLTHYRAQQWDGAIVNLSRAVEIDSAFAIAYLPLQLAAGWDNRRPLALLAAEAGVRAAAAEGVSPRHRRLLAMANAYRHGDGTEVERLGREILQQYPGDLDALYMLGETRIHIGPYYGQPAQTAREPLLRVFRQDPGRGDVSASCSASFRSCSIRSTARVDATRTPRSAAGLSVLTRRQIRPRSGRWSRKEPANSGRPSI